MGFSRVWVLSLSWTHHPVRDQNSGHMCPKVPRQLSQRLQSRPCVLPVVTCTWCVSGAPSCLWSVAAESCCPFRLAALPGHPVKTTHPGDEERLAASSILMGLSLHQQEPWRGGWCGEGGMQLGFLLDSWSWACHLDEILSHWVSHGLQLREGYNHHPTALPVQACMYTHTHTSQEYLGCKWETDHD